MTRTFMRTTFLLLLFGQFHHLLLAQSVNGFIKLRNEGMQRVASATVQSSFGNTTVSDTFGFFRLPFSGRVIGDLMTLNATKDQYRLVNVHELMRPLPSETDWVKIVMAKSVDLTLEQQLLQKIGAESDEPINARMQVLKGKTDIWINEKEELDRLTLKLKFLNETRPEVIAQLQSMDADDGTEQLRRAHKMLQNGRVDKAIWSLSTDSILATHSSKSQKITDFKYKTALLWLIGELDAAAANYRKMIALDDEQYDLKFDFSQFWYQQNQLDSAKKYGEAALRIAKQNLMSSLNNTSIWVQQRQMSEAHESLAFIEQDRNDSKAAIYNLTVSLLYREKVLMRGASIQRRMEHSRSLRMLSEMCKKARDLPCAQENFDKAFGILKSIYLGKGETTPPQYILQVAESWQSWSANYAEQGDWATAAELLSEAVAVRRYLFAEKNTDMNRRIQLTSALQNLALAYKNNRQFPQFEATFLEFVQHIEALSLTQPKNYMPQLMQQYASLSAHYLAFRRLASSDNYFEKSLALRQKMSDDTEGRDNVRKWAVFHKETAAWLSQRAKNLARMGEKHRALRSFERADSLHRLLSLIDAAVYEPARVEVLSEMSGLQMDIGKTETAERTLWQATRLLEKHQPNHDFSPIRAMMQARISRSFRIVYEKNLQKTDLDSAKHWLNLATKSLEELTILTAIESAKEAIEEEGLFHKNLKKADLAAYQVLTNLKMEAAATADKSLKTALTQQIYSTAHSLWLKDTSNAYKKRLYTEGVAAFGLAELSVGHLPLAEKNLATALQFSPTKIDWQRAYANALALQGKQDAAMKAYSALLKIDGDQRVDILGDLEQCIADKITVSDSVKVILEKLRSNAAFL